MFIGVWLIYSVVQVTAAQQTESVMHVIYPLLKIIFPYRSLQSFPGGSEVKASASNLGDLGLIPGSGRSPGEANGNPL